MSLRVWLPLTKDLRNQGLSDITTTVSGATYSSANGKLGGCYNFDGDDYITIVSDELKTLFSSASTHHSMSCWIYLNSDETDRVIIFGNFSANPFVNWELTADCKQRVCAGGTSNYTTRIDSTVVPKQTWTHLAFTYNGSSTIFYINGQKTGTINGANTLTTMSSNTFWLGSDNRSGATRLKGRLNDFRIYDHCLSPMEVKELSKGLVLHYPLNRGGWGQENLVTNSSSEWSAWYTPSVNGTNQTSSPGTATLPTSKNVGDIYSCSVEIEFSGVSAGSGGTFAFRAQGSSTSGWVGGNPWSKLFFSGTVPANGIYRYTWTGSITNASVNDTTFSCGFRADYWGGGKYRVRLIKMEPGEISTPWCPHSTQAMYTTMGLNGTTEYDCSGYCNNGEYYAYDTNGSISYTSDTPKYSVSTHIASANPTQNAASGTRYLYGHCALTNPTQMSVAFWLKPITKGYGGTTTGQGYFCTTNYEYGDTNVGSDYQASAMNHRDGAVNMNDSTSTTQCNVTFYPTIGEWHHYVYTYDGQVGRGYKDGVQTATAQFSAAKTLDSFIGVVIGFSRAGGVWRRNDACYSDFRIYATALSADDVKSLYQNCATIDPDGTIRGQIRS